MKHVEKTALPKKVKIAAALAALLVLILTASILVSALAGNDTENPVIIEPPEVIEGEARQNGLPLAYPAINSKIVLMKIKFIGKTK